MTLSEKEPAKEDLRIQYQQCLENYRLFDRHVWQIPSVTVLIISSILGVSYSYLENAPIPSSILLLFGTVLTLSMFITVKKYRFFQYHTIAKMREIEDKLSLGPLPLVTGEKNMTPQNWIERQRAGDWLAFTILFVFICLIGLLMLLIATQMMHH